MEFIFTAESFYLDEIEKIEKTKDIEASLSWQTRFIENKYKALYDLGFETVTADTASFSASFSFLKLIADRFVEFLISMPELELKQIDAVSAFTTSTAKISCESLLNSIPFVIGSEFITETWLQNIFKQLIMIFKKETENVSIPQYLSSKRQDLKVPERVFFHLVDNDDPEYPFAFLATYTTNYENRIRHLPLSSALQEFKTDHKKLLTLLSCLNKAAVVSPLLGSFVDNGGMFHPLKLKSGEAYEILKAIPSLEKNGIQCRIPNWWKRRGASIRLSVKFKQKSPSIIGFNTLLTMTPELSVDGITLTQNEVEQILRESDGLTLIKGKWIEVNQERLQSLLDKMSGYSHDVTLMDAVKMEAEEDEISFSNEDFIGSMFGKLRNSNEITKPAIPSTVTATLRPYQMSGYAWLNTMAELKLGACLADDMGLGKTLQVLTFLEAFRLRSINTDSKTDSKTNPRVLLIVPASLIGNWEKEIARFTPKMPVAILHGKQKTLSGKGTQASTQTQNVKTFLTITTYKMAMKLTELQAINWDILILDEAQAIKNADAKQTKEIKKLTAKLRIAMTGTPIENNLSNLWSLFDFLDKGLLGTASDFEEFSRSINENPKGYQKLRNIVSPFILRRLKTDKSIISDLPEKIEQIDYVSLSQRQIVLYNEAVEKIKKAMQASGELKTSMKRNGMILTSIMKLKQICNHPDQYLGQTSYKVSDSGKFEMLKAICETIHEKREKVIIFTQFTEIIKRLSEYMEEIFHAKGLVIYGGISSEKRTEIVEKFNSSERISCNPFMILSLRAGGVGLNLAGANHVIHFDRWWNPAIENQATDRAFRIGQSKNVFVHKFVTKGTIEDRINDIIESKKSLADNIINNTDARWITEMSNDEILSMITLKR